MAGTIFAHGERIVTMFCNNNTSLLWVIILILLFAADNGCGCGCRTNNNNCGCNG